MAKENAGVFEEKETEPEVTLEDLSTEDLAHVDEMLGEDDDVVLPEDDEVITLDDEEESPEPEEVKVEDKTANWKEQDYKKAFENAQKLIGRMGQEKGDLKKQLEQIQKPEPTTPEEKIKALPDTDLDTAINTLKADILKPGASIDDEDYGQKVVLFNDLKEERTMRRFAQAQNSKTAQENNSKVIQVFSNSWTKTLGEENMQEVVKFAKDKLSDPSGNITQDDLEVALHKLYPVQFKQAFSTVASEQIKQRIAKAETSKQPKLSGTGSSQSAVNTISINRLLAMDENQLADFLAPLDMKTIAKIEEAMTKQRK